MNTDRLDFVCMYLFKKNIRLFLSCSLSFVIWRPILRINATYYQQTLAFDYPFDLLIFKAICDKISSSISLS